MPSAFLYLGILLGIVILWFAVFKRPVYEAIFISFVVLVAVIYIIQPKPNNDAKDDALDDAITDSEVTE